MKILIVDDDKFFAQRLSEYLSDNGISADTVRTTSEALKANLKDYKGAIIDVMLPNEPDATGISHEEARGGFGAGIALARRFRKSNPDFPFVIFSSEIAGGEAQRWARDNRVPFIFKTDARNRLIHACLFRSNLPAVPAKITR